MFIVDTNVISEVRKIKSGRADPSVKAWIENAQPEFLFLSVVTILEIESGARSLARRDKIQGHAILAWLEDQVIHFFEGRIFPVDLPIIRRCAPLHIPDPRPTLDSILAATALVHGMTVVTRNVPHFQSMGVVILNPWNEPAND